MKKFIFLLLVPFFMVMSSFALEVVVETTDYESDDVYVALDDFDEDGFDFVITNDSDEDVYIKIDETLVYSVDEECDFIEDSQDLIFEEESDEGDDYVLVEAGEEYPIEFDSLEEYYEDEDEAGFGVTITLDINDEEYTWTYILTE